MDKIWGGPLIKGKILVIPLLILLLLPMANIFGTSMNVWLDTYARTRSVRYAHRRATEALNFITDPIGSAIHRHIWYTRVTWIGIAVILSIATGGVFGAAYAGFTIGFTTE